MFELSSPRVARLQRLQQRDDPMRSSGVPPSLAHQRRSLADERRPEGSRPPRELAYANLLTREARLCRVAVLSLRPPGDGEGSPADHHSAEQGGSDKDPADERLAAAP